MNPIYPNLFSKHMHPFGNPPLLWVLLCLLGLPDQVIGQSEMVRMDLDACIAYALEHNANIVKARFDEAIAQKDVNIALSTGLPQIDGEASLQNNFQLPVFVLPGENGESQSVPFGLPWQSSLGVTASQLVFDGRFFLGLKAARTLAELSEISTNRSKEQIAFAISRAFYLVLVTEERLNQIQANLDRVDKLYIETKAMYEEGFAEKLDVERIEINLNTLKSEVEQLRELIPVSKDVLKFQMGMPLETEVSLVADLNGMAENRPSSLNYSFDPRNLWDYKILEKQRAIETLNMRRYRVDFLPNLYAFGNYAWNWQWDAAQNFSFETGTVGLQLNIPIFDSFNKSNQIQKARLNIEKYNQDLELLKNSSNLEYRQGLSNLNNALSRLESQSENKVLAEKVYNVSRIKYKEGVGSSLEVNEAETQLKQAESLYLNSLLEYILARLDLDKLTGIFQAY